MKILVLSDSHGNVEAMHTAVETEHPQLLLFLGDGLRDAEALQERFPSLPIRTVPGNCDWGSAEEPEQLLEIDGVRILMMHGHTRRVKYSMMNACYAAQEAGAQVLLYGHTHIPSVDYDGTLYTLNPGTIGDRLRATYGILCVEAGNVTLCTTRFL